MKNIEDIIKELDTIKETDNLSSEKIDDAIKILRGLQSSYESSYENKIYINKNNSFYSELLYITEFRVKDNLIYATGVFFKKRFFENENTQGDTHYNVTLLNDSLMFNFDDFQRYWVEADLTDKELENKIKQIMTVVEDLRKINPDEMKKKITNNG